MPYNGTGTFSLSQPAFLAGTTISLSAVNSVLADLALNGLTNAVVADGQSTLTGPMKFPNGSAAAPSQTFGSDLTTGMYYIGSKHLGFSAGGTLAIAFNANVFGSGQSGNAIEINTPSGTVSMFPVGTVTDFADGSSAAPPGWLLCAGQTLSISSYPELFQAISNTYGGDGISTFAIPDCRGRATYGKDNMGGSAAGNITAGGGNFDGTVLGNTGGSQSHTLSTTELPAHNHTGSGTVTDPTHNHSLNNASNLVASGFSQLLLNVNGINVTVTENSNTTGVTVPSLSINNTGGGGAHTILDPGIILTKIIFAGRP